LIDPYELGAHLLVFIMDVDRDDSTNATYHLCTVCPEGAFQTTYLRGTLYRFRMCMGCYLYG
jgi:hypothetical protein